MAKLNVWAKLATFLDAEGKTKDAIRELRAAIKGEGQTRSELVKQARSELIGAKIAPAVFLTHAKDATASVCRAVLNMPLPEGGGRKEKAVAAYSYTQALMQNKTQANVLRAMLACVGVNADTLALKGTDGVNALQPMRRLIVAISETGQKKTDWLANMVNGLATRIAKGDADKGKVLKMLDAAIDAAKEEAAKKASK